MYISKKIPSLIISLFFIISNTWANQTTNDIAQNMESKWTPFQVSVWEKPRWLHMFPADMDVYGIRLGMPYAGDSRSMHDVYGVDVGCLGISKSIKGTTICGLGGMNWEIDGMALFGFAGEGLKVNGFVVAGGFALVGNLTGGVFGGLVTLCSDVTGVQCAGICNLAEKVNGLQLALINVADSGLQFGLLNFNKNGFISVSPFVNFGREEESEK